MKPKKKDLTLEQIRINAAKEKVIKVPEPFIVKTNKEIELEKIKLMA